MPPERLDAARGRGLVPWLVLLLALLVAAPFVPMLARPSGLLASRHSDVHSEAWPMRDYLARDLLARGELSGWNPIPFSGLPTIGSFSIPLFYPPFLPLLAASSPALYTLQFVLHLVWLAIGVFCLARRLGTTPGAAFLAAAAYALGARTLAHVYAGHMTLVAEIAWIPWVILCAEDLPRRASRLFPLALGLGAILLCGHVQVYHYTVLVVGLWALSAAWSEPPRRLVPLARTAALVAGAVLGSMLVAAVQLSPSFLLAREASRQGGVGLAFASSYSLDPLSLLGLLLPLPLGHPQDGSYWGLENWWERCASVGLPALLLAVLALRGPGPRRGRWLLPLLFLGCLLFALGDRTPFFVALYEVVPGIDHFRVPSRAMIFAALAVALLAARGLDGVEARASGGRSRWPRVLPWLGGLAVAVAAGWAVAAGPIRGAARGLVRRLYESDQGGAGHSRPLDFWLERADLAYATLRTSLLAGAVLLALVAALVWLRARSRLGRRAFLAGILVLVLAESSFVGLRHLQWRTPGPASLPSVPELSAPTSGRFRVLDQSGVLPMSLALRQGIELVGGYDPTIPGRYLRYAAGITGRDRQPPDAGLSAERIPVDGRWRLPWLAAIGARYVISRQDLAPFGLRPVRTLDGDGAVLYELPAWQPRATIHGTWRVVPDADRAFAALAAADGALSLVVEGAPPPPAVPSTGTVELLDHEPDRVRLRCESTGPAMVLLADGWSAGWRATVDGEPATVHPANVAFRAVLVPPGQHAVEMRYVAPGFLPGLMVSLAALAVLLGLWWWTGRSGRARREL